MKKNLLILVVFMKAYVPLAFGLELNDGCYPKNPSTYEEVIDSVSTDKCKGFGSPAWALYAPLGRNLQIFFIWNNIYSGRAACDFAVYYSTGANWLRYEKRAVEGSHAVDVQSEMYGATGMGRIIIKSPKGQIVWTLEVKDLFEKIEQEKKGL